MNHGEDLIIYNSKERTVVKENQLGFGTCIVNASYSNKWKVIFLQEESQRFKVYSDSLFKLSDDDKSMKELRHCVDFKYMDAYSAFLVLTPEKIKLVYVEISTNHLHSLFENAYKFRIKEIGIRVFSNQYFLSFGSKFSLIGDFCYYNNACSFKIICHKNNCNF